jgi:aminopeptidase N
MRFRIPGIYILLLLLNLLTFNSHSQTSTHKKAKKGPLPPATGVYHPSKDMDWDLIHTTLHVSFSWEKQELFGKAIIQLKPHIQPLDSLVLDAKNFTFDSVSASIPLSQPYLYNKEQITLYFGKSISPFDTITVYINYTAHPEEIHSTRRSNFIYGNKGLYFINPLGKDSLKPKQIWTQGQTESSSCWFPTIDSPNQKTTQEMFIRVDSIYTALSNGLLQEVKTVGNEKIWHWKMNKPHTPYLFMMAIGEYSITNDQWRDIPLSYYVEPEFAPYAKKIFGNTPEMMEFFSQLLKYPYPWPKYSQVCVRDFVSGAMENTSATILMEDVQITDRELYDDHWDAIIAHELFHHWFGNLVTCESWANLALNESFATYSEYLWYNYKYGKEAGIAHLKEMYDEYIDESHQHIDPIIRYRYRDRDDMFDRHTYSKGGLILHHLRSFIGDTAFFKAINLYLKNNEYTQVEIDELRMAFEDVTGKDLHWFFEQWFFKAGHPKLKINYSEGSKNRIEIKIKQVQDTTYAPVFRFPLKVVYKTKQDSTLRETLLWVSQSSQTFILPYLYEDLDCIIFNPDFSLLAEINVDKTPEHWLNQAYYGNNHLVRIEGLTNFVKKINMETVYYYHPRARDVLERFLSDSAYKTEKQMAMLQFTKYYVPGVDIRFLPMFERIALNDKDGNTQSIALRIITRYQPDKFLPMCRKFLQHPSYYVMAGALECLLEVNDKETIAQLSTYEQTNNLYVLIVIADYYIRKKELGHYEWLAKKTKESSVGIQYNLIHYIYNYVIFDKANRSNAIQLMDSIFQSAKQDFVGEEALIYKKKIQDLKRK